ncbi:DUF2544 domain-containing protein [Escherichia coli]|nr:DUF2544 domain-containing protein [Escherichia coli]
MKILRHVLCLLLLLMFNTCGQAATKVGELYVPAGASSPATEFEFHLIIATPDSVNYAIFKATFMPNSQPDLVSWTGDSSTQPSMSKISDSRVSMSACPGLEQYDSQTKTGWTCNELKMFVYYDGNLHGCPWIVSSFVKSRDPFAKTYDDDFPDYIGPTKVSSSCPAVPLAPYDVSWNENYVVHNKVVRLQSTGGVIEQTLPTFLMENGKLCNGNNFDERGAYCRFIAQQMTFSTSGCDNAKVTVTPEPQPITSRQLHDTKLRVDTTSRQPIDSTCRFTYILNMY